MAKPQPALDKLPHNFQAEQCMLGGILQNTTYLNTAAEIIVPGDLFDPRHQRIYRACLEMQNDEKRIDLVTLCDYLAGKGDPDSASTAAYVSSLMDGVPSISNVPEYARIVKEKARLRVIASAADLALRQAMDPTANVDQIETSWAKSFTNGNGHNGNGNGNGKFRSYSLMEFLKANFPPKEHLIEGIIPRSTPGMVIALPHRLKSWFTIGIALGATNDGLLMGKLAVEKPLRTYLAQLEDWPGELQARLTSLLRTTQFLSCRHENVRILPRCELDLTQKESFDFMAGELREFKPDLVILDVLRKFFSGDVNSPKETAAFLKRVDQLADICGASIFLVHHENRKKEEIMLAAAGSYNWAGWAQVMIQFARKTETRTPEGPITSVEIEVDNKLAPSPEPMRLTLNTSSPMPLILEAVEDGTGFGDAMDQLGEEWDVNALCDVLGCHRSNANRRIKKWIEQGKVEKIKTGKRGRGRTLAMYKQVSVEDSSSPD
jgi:hypothetical protein